MQDVLSVGNPAIVARSLSEVEFREGTGTLCASGNSDANTAPEFVFGSDIGRLGEPRPPVDASTDRAVLDFSVQDHLTMLVPREILDDLDPSPHRAVRVPPVPPLVVRMHLVKSMHPEAGVDLQASPGGRDQPEREPGRQGAVVEVTDFASSLDAGIDPARRKIETAPRRFRAVAVPPCVTAPTVGTVVDPTPDHALFCAETSGGAAVIEVLT